MHNQSPSSWRIFVCFYLGIARILLLIAFLFHLWFLCCLLGSSMQICSIFLVTLKRTLWHFFFFSLTPNLITFSTIIFIGSYSLIFPFLGFKNYIYFLVCIIFRKEIMNINTMMYKYKDHLLVHYVHFLNLNSHMPLYIYWRTLHSENFNYCFTCDCQFTSIAIFSFLLSNAISPGIIKSPQK